MKGCDLYLVRHGGCGAAGYLGGGSDPGLDDEGRRQAAALGKYLSACALGAVYVSPQRRALETAALIAASHPPGSLAEPIVMESLREMHFGGWEGLSYDEAAARGGGRFSAWIDDPEKVSPPGGEEFEAFSRRVLACFGDIEARAGGPVLVVSHGGVLRIFLGRVLGLDFKGTRRFSLNRGSVSLVRVYSDGTEVLESLNHVPGRP